MQALKIESIDLEITTKCNLACPYCYIEMLKLKEQGCIGDISDELIEQLFDLIEKYGTPRPHQIELQNGQKKWKQASRITFYGGEPMLVFDRVKYVIEKSKEKRMQLGFYLVSNGTLGTKEQFDYLRSNKCGIQRSIDGYPEAQEKYRPNSVEKYLAIGTILRDYYGGRRMTIQPEFAGDLLKSMYWFEDHGYRKGMSPQPNFYTEWTPQDIYNFRKSLWDVAKYYIQRWKADDPFYFFYIAHELEKRLSNKKQCGCGAAWGLHCLSYDGWLYACHRFSKEPHDGPFCFGHINDILRGTAKGYGEDVLTRVQKCKSGKTTEDDWPDQCRYCIAYKTCEQGCMHSNVKCTGDLDLPPKLYCVLKGESVKVVDWIDRQLGPIDRQWWKKGNTMKKEFLKSLSDSCPDCLQDGTGLDRLLNQNRSNQNRSNQNRSQNQNRSNQNRSNQNRSNQNRSQNQNRSNQNRSNQNRSQNLSCDVYNCKKCSGTNINKKEPN